MRYVIIWAVFAVTGMLVGAAERNSEWERSNGTEGAWQSGNLTFTNADGRTFSVAEVTRQVQELNVVVQRTLPMLQAVTQSFSNSVDTSTGGVLSGILAEVLKRDSDKSRTRGGEETQQENSWSNLVAVLQGVLTTNEPTAQPTTASTLKNLAVLQAQLQPVGATLEKMGVANPARNEVANPEVETDADAETDGGWTRQRPLEPTGRD